MNDKILLVDDEANVLSGYTRNFEGYFNIETANGGIDALTRIKNIQEPYAVVLTDLRMPGISGVELLRQTKELTPDTVRIMISGNADLQATLDAVNEGAVFRFLTKPCTPQDLVKALEAGLNQYDLIISKKELLNKTLNGSIQTLTDIISLFDPTAFGQAQLRREIVLAVARAMKIEPFWDIEIAAMLCDISNVTIPSELIYKQQTGGELNPSETEILRTLPQVSSKLLSHIPRLESVAKIVLYQDKNYDGSGFPMDNISKDEIPLGSRIIKIVKTILLLNEQGHSIEEALKALELHIPRYDTKIMQVVSEIIPALSNFTKSKTQSVKMVYMNELRVGQILRSDVESKDGFVILKAGHMLRSTHLQRIQNFAQISGLKEPIAVEASSIKI